VRDLRQNFVSNHALLLLKIFCYNVSEVKKQDKKGGCVMKKAIVKKMVCMFMVAALSLGATTAFAQDYPGCDPDCDCYIYDPGGPGKPDPMYCYDC
jgi:hypothetical protein